MLVQDPDHGVCRFIWEQQVPGPVWLEFAFLGEAEQRLEMTREEGYWVAEVRLRCGWLRYGFRTAAGIKPDKHPATIRDRLGRRFTFTVVSERTLNTA